MDKYVCTKPCAGFNVGEVYKVDENGDLIDSDGSVRLSPELYASYTDSNPQFEEFYRETNKYLRDLKGKQVDVYDVLNAFEVTCPALQHLIKKALCAGLRGHKDKPQDLQDIVDSANRAKELYDES